MKRAMAKPSRTTADVTQKRRLLRIGPGMIIAIILSIVVGYRYMQVQTKISQQSKMPPVVERQTISSSFEEKSGPTPDVKFILDHRSKLGLNTSQVEKIETLQRNWTKFYQPKIEAANAAAKKTGGYLASAKDNRRTPVGQIQNEAGPVIALSREISSARRDYWNRAVKILTPEQRIKLQIVREAEWAAKMKTISDRVRRTAK